MSALPAGAFTVTDALFAKARKPSPGLEGVKGLTDDPRFATGLPLVALYCHHPETWGPDGSRTMMRYPPAQPTMTKDWTGTSESESAPQPSDVDAETL